MLSAFCERDGDSVEVTAAAAVEDPDALYRCPACGQQVFPRRSASEFGIRANFEHAPEAAPCRRSPKRPDRRKSLRSGGRRADD